jgi:hypothetical protein
MGGVGVCVSQKGGRTVDIRAVHIRAVHTGQYTSGRPSPRERPKRRHITVSIYSVGHSGLGSLYLPRSFKTPSERRPDNEGGFPSGEREY